MTLKQLLDSLTFDEIAPFIDLEDGKNTLAPFKQHFDYLRHLTPMDAARGEVSVGYWKDPDIEEDDNSEHSLFAGSLEGDSWESCLAKEIVLDEDVTASDAEVAACCLWHTSFYGFLPEELAETFNRWHEGKGKSKYYIKKFSDILPTRRQMQSVPSFHQSVRRKMKFHKKHRTVQEIREFRDLFDKDYRKWRYWKRVQINSEYSKRIKINAEFIETVLESGTDATPPPPRIEFKKLFLANHVSIHRCDTLAYGAAGRLDYLRELIEKYGLLNEAPGLPNSFVCISTSPEHPLTRQEKDDIKSLVTSGHGGEHRIWAKFDTSIGEEFRADIAYYE